MEDRIEGHSGRGRGAQSPCGEYAIQPDLSPGIVYRESARSRWYVGAFDDRRAQDLVAAYFERCITESLSRRDLTDPLDEYIRDWSLAQALAHDAVAAAFFAEGAGADEARSRHWRGVCRSSRHRRESIETVR